MHRTVVVTCSARDSFRSGSHPILFAFLAALLGSACDSEYGVDAFAPTQEVVRADERIARCNTVHSLRLPQAIRDRYDFPADENTAVISCSLQIVVDGVTQNLPAEVSGTATTLTGNLKPLGFREVVTEDALSYVATFALEAKHEVRFDLEIADEQTGTRYEMRFVQPIN